MPFNDSSIIVAYNLFISLKMRWRKYIIFNKLFDCYICYISVVIFPIVYPFTIFYTYILNNSFFTVNYLLILAVLNHLFNYYSIQFGV